MFILANVFLVVPFFPRSLLLVVRDKFHKLEIAHTQRKETHQFFTLLPSTAHFILVPDLNSATNGPLLN